MPALVWLVAAAAAVDLQAGQIIEKVTCEADPSQSYALYVPSNYTPAHPWPVVFAFDPGARGRVPVERYRAAAEKYGYIVVGSNNSRNGPMDLPKVLAAMTTDVAERLSVDPKRVYLAGMSGGARVALQIALSSKDIAGVIASSAGYPDNRLRKTLPFPVFATAGTDDFNHLEMRHFDAALTTSHHLAIFNGGHVWLSSELAVEAIEWMEVQAMKSGLKPRDEAEIDRLLAARKATVDPTKTDQDTFLVLQSIADAFQGLRDVSALAARAAELGRDKNVRDAIKKDSDADAREESMLRAVNALADRLRTEERPAMLSQLRQKWKDLSAQAKQPNDSIDRQIARRVLSALSADNTDDEEYKKIISEFRIGRGGI